MNRCVPESGSLRNITVVLLQPKKPGNVGLIARAMKNMGVTELAFVGEDFKHGFWAKTMAVHAKDVLKTAKRFSTLREAIATSALVVGTTARGGGYRSHGRSPRELAPKILAVAKQAPVSLVFGPEDHGLTNRDIKHCHWLIRIPAHPDYTSLNVAQAAMICLYELFLASLRRSRAKAVQRAPTEEIEQLYDRMRATLLKIGFLNSQNPEHILLNLRRMFARGGLLQRDVSILNGLFHQIEWYVEKESRQKGDHSGPQ